MVPVRIEYDTEFGVVTGYLAELRGPGIDRRFMGLSPSRSLQRRPHPHPLVDEALGRGIDRASLAATRRVDVERRPVRCAVLTGHRRRQRHLVGDRSGVVGEQIFGSEHPFEIEQAAEEIGLAAAGGRRRSPLSS